MSFMYAIIIIENDSCLASWCWTTISQNKTMPVRNVLMLYECKPLQQQTLSYISISYNAVSVCMLL